MRTLPTPIAPLLLHTCKRYTCLPAIDSTAPPPGEPQKKEKRKKEIKKRKLNSPVTYPPRPGRRARDPRPHTSALHTQTCPPRPTAFLWLPPGGSSAIYGREAGVALAGMKKQRCDQGWRCSHSQGRRLQRGQRRLGCCRGWGSGCWLWCGR